MKIVPVKKDVFCVPSFGYPGGKARIRDKIISIFPRAGRIYLEPFVGRGNLFFGALSAGLTFSKWWINDSTTSVFFRAIKEVNVDDLPYAVDDRATFDKLKAERTSAVSLVLEPAITYLGKGYSKSNFVGVHAHGISRYKKNNYKKRILAAKKLLQYVEITDKSWEMLDWGSLDYRDFVYLDPPYIGTCKGLPYNDIDHAALIEMLSVAQFRWVLSGYDSELYRKKLGAPVIFTRQSPMALFAGSKLSSRKECLWSNTWQAVR